MADSLQIQELPPADRVLAIAQLVAGRSEDGWFAPRQVRALFRETRIPEPAGLTSHLNRLRSTQLLNHDRRRRNHTWSLTPAGDARANRLIPGSLGESLAVLLPNLSAPAEVAGTRHAVLSPLLAPTALELPIRRMLAAHPFERNIFCMARFPDGEHDPVGGVMQTLRDAAAEHDLVLHVATDRTLDALLFPHVAAYIWSSAYGVVLFEDRAGRGLNGNMLIEAGAMTVLGRRCLLLRDTSLDRSRMPSCAQVSRLRAARPGRGGLSPLGRDGPLVRALLELSGRLIRALATPARWPAGTSGRRRRATCRRARRRR